MRQKRASRLLPPHAPAAEDGGVLLSRSGELEMLRAVTGAARQGRAGVIAVVGEAGMGKSALIDAVARSQPEGTRVLRVLGSIAESPIGYSGLSALLRPVREVVSQVPAPHAEPLTAVLTGVAGRETSLTELGHAVLVLLDRASGLQPLVVLVDDWQWVDRASRQVLAFVGRRLAGEAVAMIITSRPGTALPDVPPAPLTLSPLDSDAAAALVSSVRADLAPGARRDLLRQAGGNPLALIEGARRLREGERAGSVRVVSPSERIRDAYRAELDELPDATREVMLIVACEVNGELGVVAAAAGVLGRSIEDLDPARQALLVTIDGPRVGLRHPLLTACLLDRATSEQRRRAHLALAQVMAESDPDRALWHRADSAQTYDDVLADDLAAAARRRLGSGHAYAAAAAWQRSADLTSSVALAAERMLEAAAAAVRAGDITTAEDALRRARALHPLDGELEGRAWVVEASVAGLRRHSGSAAALLLDAAPRLPPDAARRALTTALVESTDEGDAELTERAVRMIECAYAWPEQQHYVLLGGVFAREFRRGHEAPADRALVEDCAVRLSRADDPLLLELLADAMARKGDLVGARRVHERARSAAVRAGDLPLALLAASGVVFCEHTLGRWTKAIASATELLDLASSVYGPESSTAALLALTEIEAARGQEQSVLARCRRLVELADELDDPVRHVLAERRLGLLYLGLQRHNEAVRHLERALDLGIAAGLRSAFMSPVPDLVEVYLRIGRDADAARLGWPFVEQADAGTVPPRARAARVRGLLAADGEYDEPFTRSVELDISVGLRFYAARTLVCHGERLRRDRRVREARDRLLRASAVFRELGAQPWLQRCQRELGAAGGDPSPAVAIELPSALTSQELQIALRVAEGQRNKDIAAALFLSHRTVEFHLSSAYRKLGVANRAQLTRLVHLSSA